MPVLTGKRLTLPFVKPASNIFDYNLMSDYP